ncbi:response regulator [Methanoregula sp.]|jgi:DNA-binding response OmpR family regulator|uniref:response regulator n=1 Tax=Methanoregula sp. TaxID=2052170 RepID=UPI003C26151C
MNQLLQTRKTQLTIAVILTVALILAVAVSSVFTAWDMIQALFLAILIAACVFITTWIAVRTFYSTIKKVVLIVDDEPEIVNIIDIFLGKKGYETLKANSGTACLDILKKQIPDLILLDVNMTPMDGWRTLEQIKNNPNFKSIPVLMLTADTLTTKMAKQYNICLEDYITKPFRLEEVYASIDSILLRRAKLKETLALTRKVGIEKEKFCEFATLTQQISFNKKILNMLSISQVVPEQANLNILDDLLVVDYITIKTRNNEKRAEQLRYEFNAALRGKGLPELSL